jgi:hypothetical protein
MGNVCVTKVTPHRREKVKKKRRKKKKKKRRRRRKKKKIARVKGFIKLYQKVRSRNG